MTDTTLCADDACPSSRQCYRYLAEPGDHQNYFSPRNPGEDRCEYYIPAPEALIPEEK